MEYQQNCLSVEIREKIWDLQLLSKQSVIHGWLMLGNGLYVSSFPESRREAEEELSTAAISKQTKKGWQVDGKKQSGAPTFN